LPATSFEWGKPNPSAQRAFVDLGAVRTGPNLENLAGSEVLAGGEFAYRTAPFSYLIAGDFNGDGKTDILERNRLPGNQNQQHLYQSNADGNGWTPSTPLIDVPGANLQVMETGDFDGDGKLDLLVADQASVNANPTNWRLCPGSARSQGKFVCNINVTFPNAVNSPTGTLPEAARAVRDFNADGKDDLFMRASDIDTSIKPQQCLSTGTGFTCMDVGDMLAGGFGGKAVVGNEHADVDGDGRVDKLQLRRCYYAKNPDLGTMEWTCGDGDSAPYGVDVGSAAEYGAVQVNGFWLPFPNSRNSVLAPPEGGTLSGDMNADGYSDLALGTVDFVNSTGSLRTFGNSICYSKGNGDADCRPIPSSGDPAFGASRDHLALMVGDFDGDGVVDVLRPGNGTSANPLENDIWTEDTISSYQLCHIGPNATEAYPDQLFHRCEAWSGPQFFTKNIQLQMKAARPDLLSLQKRERTLFYGDFNGDGKTDIVSYLGNGNWKISGAADQAKPGEALDKLVKVTNGIGHIESAKYALANSTTVYQIDASMPNGSVAAVGKRAYPGRHLVSRITRTNGVAGVNAHSFAYAGYANDATARGSLGFARIDKTNLQTNAVETTWPSQVFPNVGAPLFAKALAGNGNALNDGEFEYLKNQVTLTNGAVLYRPYAKQTKSTRRDLNGSVLGTNTTVNEPPDEWGNILHTVDTTEGPTGELFKVDRLSTYFPPNLATWRNSELEKVTETRTVPLSTVARTVEYAYDARGLVEREIRQKASDALRTTVVYGRNAYGQVTKTTLSWMDIISSGTVTRINDTTFDAIGRFPSTTKNALGHIDNLEFDPRNGAPSKVVTANNLTITKTSDAFGRVRSEVATDKTESLSYQKRCTSNCPSGAAVVTIRDIRRAGVRIAVPSLVFSDSAGHVLRTLTWGSNPSSTGVDSMHMITTELAYDSLGRLADTYQPRFVKDTDSLGDSGSAVAQSTLARHNEYDELNRVISSYTLDENGAPVTSRIEYNGAEVKFTNPKEFFKIERRDAWARLEFVTDAKAGVTKYRHDAFDNLTNVVDPRENIVSVKYNDNGHRFELKDPDLGIITYAVDAIGQVRAQTSPIQNAANVSTVMTYDLLGRMTARVSTDMIAGWIYDKDPNAVGTCAEFHSCGKLFESYTMAGPTKDFSRRHTYDIFGRPEVTLTNLDVPYKSQVAYDAFGRQIRETHRRDTGPEKVFDRRYDAYNALARIERGGLLLWTITGIDAAGRMTTASLGNGLNALKVNRTYNPMTGRLSLGSVVNAQGNSQLSEGYFYDTLGNVTTRTQKWNAEEFTELFGYDELNRLQTSAIGAETLTFTYNSIGNITSKTGTGTGDYVYPSDGASRPHAVSSIPGIGAFAYDANGNLRSGAGRTAEWTDFDMPRILSKGSADTSVFKYGPDHQRTRQTRTHNGVSTEIIYAGAMEVEGEGAARVVKTYWPMGLGVEIDRGTAATELRWTHLDLLGSVVAITDETGAIKEKMAYDSWGKRRSLTGHATPDSTDGQVDNKGFTGHEMLDQLDLVHMNGRVYDPMVARFMSADTTIQNPEHGQSYNRYSYVWNNPTNLTDPSGFAADDGTPDDRDKQLEADKKKEAERVDPHGWSVTANETPQATPTKEIKSINPPSATNGPSYATRVAAAARGQAAGLFHILVNAIGATIGENAETEIRSFENMGSAVYDNPTLANDFQAGHNFGYFLGFGSAIGMAKSSPKAMPLTEKVEAIHAVLDPIAQGRRTTAVLRTKSGDIAGGGAKKDLIPAQRKMAEKLDAKPVKLKDEHAEVTVLDHAKKHGQKPVKLEVSRDICANCKVKIEESGGKLVGPRSATW
jgi:RHS repeat-associated protein